MDGVILTDAPSFGAGRDLRREVREQVRANIRQLLVDAVSEKLGLAMAVAAGPVQFREIFVREMGSFWGHGRAEADEVANRCYQFLQHAWSHQFPGESATAFLDAVHVPSPQSEAEVAAEVEDAWEVEIAGSEAGMQRHYYGSARTRKGKDVFSTAWQKDPSKATA